MNSYDLPSFDVIRYQTDVKGTFTGGSQAELKAELAYVTLSEAPYMIYFCVRPTDTVQNLLAYNAGR